MMLNITVIGFSGLAGSGKTTAAHYLETEHGFERFAMAGALKRMARAVLTPREMEGDLKEAPRPHLGGKSPRQFMQMLGTEFGRQMIGEDLWVDLWRQEVEHYALVEQRDIRVVVDDVRFANEAAAIRALGGRIYRITRTGAGSTTGGTHASEAMDFEVDGEIANDGDEDDFMTTLDILVARWFSAA